jgi:hypothetical protein
VSYYTGGDYFMAGGFGSFFKKVGRAVTSLPVKAVKGVVRLNTSAAARVMSLGRTSDLKQAALDSVRVATSVVGAGGAGGRLGEIMSPVASPALASTDGTPPGQVLVTQASQGVDPNLMMMLMMMLFGQNRRR